jgi:hypothetical protein
MPRWLTNYAVHSVEVQAVSMKEVACRQACKKSQIRNGNLLEMQPAITTHIVSGSIYLLVVRAVACHQIHQISH